MGQYKSYKQVSLENRLVALEQGLSEIKAIQQYSPSQINYSYQSNPITINSYYWMNGQSEYGYGIVASLLFTSRLSSIFPRIVTRYITNNSGYGFVQYERIEYVSKNQSRIVFQAVDNVVPMSAPYNFSMNVIVNSNVAGTLILEKSYVLPIF